MMAKTPIQAIRPRVSSAIRRLCSAAAAAAAAAAAPAAAPAPDLPPPPPFPPRLSPAAAAEPWKPLYRRLSPHMRSGEISAVLNHWATVEQRKVDPHHLLHHVREFRKFRRYTQALEIMDWMETNGLKMPNESHALRLDLISKIKGIDSAEEYFSSLPESLKNFAAYGTLLGCYCKENMVDKASALCEKMNELNIAFDTLAYNNLMSLYLKLGQLEKVMNLYQHGKENNVFQDNCTHRILMKCYASMNDMDSVEKLVQSMEDDQGTLDWFTYCHLAGLYNSSGLFDSAISALRKAELVMHSRDLSPFRYLISLYAGAGNLEEVKRVWNLLKAKVPRPNNTNPMPSNVNYVVMLQALLKLDAMDFLKQCFEEWEAVCVIYDINVVNTVIAAYLRKDMLEDAELLQERAAKKGAQSDLKTFALFIDYYLKIGDLELAWKSSAAATSIVKRGRVIAEVGI